MYRAFRHGGFWRMLAIFVTLVCGSLLLTYNFFDKSHGDERSAVQWVAGSSNNPGLNWNSSEVSQALTDVQEQEIILSDGVLYYQRGHYDKRPSLLWLVMTKDEKSWGKKNKEHGTRSFNSFLNLLESTQLNLTDVSLGLLTSCEEEYHLYKSATEALGLARVTVILHKGYLEDVEPVHGNRKDPQIQTARRSELAKLRNYLMLRALHHESHIIWLDADVFVLDEGIVQTMLTHAERRKDVGLLTARCTYGPNQNYDKNAWTGTRAPPADLELADPISANAEKEAQPQRLVDELIAGTTDDDLIPLTAVGATILYIRAALVWQGLNFPHQYTVGTRWTKDGYDGLETEGLCYRATGLSSAGCFLLGGKWHVKHMIN